MQRVYRFTPANTYGLSLLKVYDYVNHVLGLDIKEHGQENLMSIQYFGRGLNDTKPDRYTPHCDGKCDGLPHQHATRMATMVMYCSAATRGGHTNFRNAGVHVKPVLASAIFFSYIDPETRIMDEGECATLTSYCACSPFAFFSQQLPAWRNRLYNALGLSRV